ncbi:winged helix-turn-helix domain-containing tetratricopeptide repeat protein [Ramlibacter albus]|uniref:Winged helix-turn-helix domain-containing protein n=1 Tax=Ramlibacter albus TaxID=2079448 RepID=A0A923M7R7_9BURK|nr:winged helix-turn-helix domain-containing protein [Ramlibacter albus]MBC5764935.1 winged helix-turn-helix domain-containing protein [Ramlibacter albus]
MNAPGERKLRVGHGLFDPLTGELCLDGRTTHLRPRTAALLAYLVQQQGRVVGKDELLEKLWPDVVVTEDSIVQCVKEIRHALGEAGREWIRTLPRQGYLFLGNHLDDARVKPGAQHRRVIAACLAIAVLAILLAWRYWPEVPPVTTYVVLPFANTTGDPRHDRTADDITEAITDVLGRHRSTVIALSTARTFKDKPVDVQAIGRKLNVRYVLQGALRMDETQLVLRLRLAEVASSVQLWQQDFRMSPGDPELRPNVIGGVVQVLGQQVIQADARRSGRPEFIQAAENVRRAMDVWRGTGSDIEKNAQMIALLEDAVRLNDDLAVAWIWLSVTYLQDLAFSAEPAQRLRRAAVAVEEARKRLPLSDSILSHKVRVMMEQGRFAEALATSERAIELNPDNAVSHMIRGWVLNASGRHRQALVQLEKAIRMSPRDPSLPGMLAAAGVAHMRLRDEAAALDRLADAARLAPRDGMIRLVFAGALGAAGRLEEARAQLAQFERLRPGFTLGRLRAFDEAKGAGYAERRQWLYEGLRRAGMPE